MKEFLTVVVLWLVVPIILFGVVLLASSIVSRTSEGEHRLSVRAGFWAGLVAFVAFVAYEIDSFHIPDFTKAASLHLSLIYFFLAIAFGYLFLFFLKKFIPTRLGGFIVFILVFTGASSLFSYFFVQAINHILLSATLGVALGALIHMIVAPKYVYDIFAKTEQKNPIQGEQ